MSAHPQIRADAKRSRAALVEAALSLLGAGMRPTVDAVAAAAGVGRATAFRHFPTRDALFGAALDAALDDAASTLSAAELDVGDVAEALTRAARELIGLSSRYAVLTASVPIGGEEVEKRAAKVLAPVVTLVRRAQRTGVLRDDMPARWLADVLVDLAHLAGTTSGRRGRHDPIDLVLEIFLRGAGSPTP